MTSFASSVLLLATADTRTGGRQRRRRQQRRHTTGTMTPGTMAVGVDKGGIKNGSADDSGPEESAGKYNNQTGTGVGEDDDDTRMLLSWMTGVCAVDNGSADYGDTGKHMADSGG